MTTSAPLTRERLKELLRYDPKTGSFYWRRSQRGLMRGSKAGCLNDKGYVQIRVDGVVYQAHRLVFLYVDGKFPPHWTDHIDRNRQNNRRENLRCAEPSENQCNRTMANNTSGAKGVSWDVTRNRWIARIQFKHKSVNLGRFESLTDAAAAYEEAATRLHKEFRRLEP